MNALVTGAGGFLGRHLVKQLVDRGDQVTAFSRRTYAELEALGVRCMEGDVRDPAAIEAACKGIDVVYHTAGVAGIWGPRRHYFTINTQGTNNVIAASQKAGVSRLVYSSSPSVTFDGTDQCGIDESAPYPHRWLCHYQHSKATAEQAVLAANGEYGLCTCALRPHLIWGPGDPHLVPRLLDRARRGKLRQIGDGTNMMDVTFVTNAAHAHVLAGDALTPNSPVCGNAYFVSQGEPVNCWQWINEILQMAGLAPVEKAVSFKTAWRAGAALETLYRLFRLRREPPMTRFLAAQLATSHYFDMQRARDDLGYEPIVSMTEGMFRLSEEIAVNSG